jgi:hypothetical protein
MQIVEINCCRLLENLLFHVILVLSKVIQSTTRVVPAWTGKIGDLFSKEHLHATYSSSL